MRPRAGRAYLLRRPERRRKLGVEQSTRRPDRLALAHLRTEVLLRRRPHVLGQRLVDHVFEECLRDLHLQTCTGSAQPIGQEGEKRAHYSVGKALIDATKLAAHINLRGRALDAGKADYCSCLPASLGARSVAGSRISASSGFIVGFLLCFVPRHLPINCLWCAGMAVSMTRAMGGAKLARPRTWRTTPFNCQSLLAVTPPLLCRVKKPLKCFCYMYLGFTYTMVTGSSPMCKTLRR